MSPLQVMDQMACLEGGPWIPLESQQDTLSKASWRRVGRKGGKERELGEDRKRRETGAVLSGLSHMSLVWQVLPYILKQLIS